MENDKQYLDDKTKEIFKKFLSLEDHIEAADMSGFSFSTVNNIIQQRTKVSKRNESVLKSLHIVCYKRMSEYLQSAAEEMNIFEKLPEVKEYLEKLKAVKK